VKKQRRYLAKVIPAADSEVWIPVSPRTREYLESRRQPGSTIDDAIWKLMGTETVDWPEEMLFGEDA
jgi:hypothetical protein